MKISANSKLDEVRFGYGKYRGQHISEVNDLGYIAWYMHNFTDPNALPEINCCAGILEANGYKVNIKKTDANELRITYMTPEQLAEIAKAEAARDAMDKIVSTGQPFNFTFTRNVYNDGSYSEGQYARFYFKFDDVRYIGGRYPCVLPMINGKAKRIKNLEFTITDYSFKYEKDQYDNDFLVITVKDMKTKNEMHAESVKAAKAAMKEVKRLEKEKKMMEREAKKAAEKAMKEAAREAKRLEREKKAAEREVAKAAKKAAKK